MLISHARYNSHLLRDDRISLRILISYLSLIASENLFFELKIKRNNIEMIIIMSIMLYRN